MAGELIDRLINPYNTEARIQALEEKIKRLERALGESTGGGGVRRLAPPGKPPGLPVSVLPTPEIQALTQSNDFTLDGIYNAVLTVSIDGNFEIPAGSIGFTVLVTPEGQTAYEVNGPEYNPDVSTDYSTLRAIEIGRVPTGKVTLQAKLRHVAGDSDYGPAYSLAVAGDTTAPSAPAGLAVAPRAGAVAFSFTVPSDSDYAFTEVWKGLGDFAVLVGGDAVLAATSNSGKGEFGWDEKLDAGLYDTVKIRHVDNSGNITALSSGVAIAYNLIDEVNVDFRPTPSVPLALLKDADGNPRLLAYWDDGATEAFLKAIPVGPEFSAFLLGVDSGGTLELFADGHVALTSTDTTTLHQPNGLLLEGGSVQKADGELKFEMSGDTFGGAAFTLHNRNGENGVILELQPTLSFDFIQLIDLILRHGGGQRNIRLEGRVGETTTGVAQEFQIGNPGSTSHHTAMSDNGLVQRTGYIKGPEVRSTGDFANWLTASDSALYEAAAMHPAWVDSTVSTRKGALLFRAYDWAGTREGFRVEADGTAARIGFYGATGQTKPTITGARGGNVALTNLLIALANLGLITNSTSA